MHLLVSISTAILPPPIKHTYKKYNHAYDDTNPYMDQNGLIYILFPFGDCNCAYYAHTMRMHRAYRLYILSS